MSIIGSKLLMCVCAGATGAAIVPVAQRAKAALSQRPAVHRVAAVHHRASPTDNVSLPLNCTPSIAGFAPVALPVEAAPQRAADAEQTLVPTSSVRFGVAGIGDFGGGGGVLSPGMGQGGGGVSPGPAPFVPPFAPTPPSPVDSVPEPGPWTMMISGFGLTGAGMRWQRRHEI